MSLHGLLEQTVEQQAPGTGASPVEAERILVEVVFQVLAADSALIGAGEHALQQSDDAVHSRHEDVRWIR